jgi:micrococcal nuclease
MPFSQEQVDRLRGGISRALASDQPSDWEQRFLRDMRARLDRYGPKTRLSDKQYQKLMQLIGSERAESSQVAGPDERRPSGSLPRQSSTAGRLTTRSRGQLPHRFRRRSWLEKRIRRKARSLSFLLVMGLVVALLELINVVMEKHPSGTGSLARQVDAPGFMAVDGRTSITAGRIRVLDGDTASLSGYRQRIRLVGFNTPEVFSPKCNHELQAGNRATARLKELLRTARTIEFERVACSCAPETEGTRSCNHGRLCGSLYADGRDVGDILISEGLAARYRCSRTSCPPPPGNWCG